MGGQESKQRKKFLCVEEIEKICVKNIQLENIFNKYKNVNGVIHLKDLEAIFDRKLNFKIVKKLYKICQSEKDKFDFKDFKYLYSLFYTENHEAKLNFITDLIFVMKNQITFEKYMNKANFIFENSSDLLEKLIDIDFISSICNKEKKISKEVFLKNFDEREKIFIKNFSFLDLEECESNSLNEMGSKLVLSSNRLKCECMKNTQVEKNELNSFDISKLGGIEDEFKKIEKENNGLFPINHLKIILIELDINRNLIKMIISYFKKRTQKSFIDMTSMKNFLCRFFLGNEEKIEMLFEIISYPKESISLADLISLVKSYKAGISSSEIQRILESLNINGNSITLNNFKEIFKCFSTYINDNLELIQYIPFLYFMLKCEDKIKEKNCIEIIMRNNKDLKAFIDSLILIEKEFYLVNIDFWVSWCKYTNFNNISQYKITLDENNLNINENKPQINNNLISDSNGKLLQGLVYMKDYVILSQKIYRLFKNWYVCLGPDIKRYKIETINKYINSNPKIKYEIEVYPVFVKFLKFEDLLMKSSKKSIEEIRIYLSDLANTSQDSRNTANSHPFSKLTKFKDILKFIEMKSGIESSKSRLWITYQNRFYLVQNENTLEEDSIADFAMIICETLVNSRWPSDNLQTKSENKINDTKSSLDSKIFVGLQNIGNTCYMNAVLQTFINNRTLKDILLKSNFDNSINFANKYGVKGIMMLEFINILREKWIENKTIITPKIFKENISKLNEMFSGYDQQDAHEFYTFLLDSLHEEINLKNYKEYIQNPEYLPNATEEDLADEYWANNLRRNTSFIHSLYLGQLKSTLSCQNCSKEKVSFETFSSVSLPIPQGGKIILEVILFRLPFSFKVYYENFHSIVNHANNKNDIGSQDTRIKLDYLRRRSIEYSIDLGNIDESSIYLTNKSYHDIIINNINMNQGIIQAKQYKYSNHYESSTSPIDLADVNYTSNENLNVNQTLRRKNENVYMSKLITNIPIRIKIEIEKKEKVENILHQIKKINDLELERDNKYTQLLLLFQGTFLDKNLTIDDCFENNSILHVHELLNTRGISKLFNYANCVYDSVIPINFNVLQTFGRISNNNNIESNYNLKEMNESVIQIKHRYPASNLSLLFSWDVTYNKLDTFFNAMLLNNKDSIKSFHLYEYIWDKYEYFLINPYKIEINLWWKIQKTIKSNSNDNIVGLVRPFIPKKESIKTVCSPFVIKILDGENLSCVTCPWYKFCSGCVLDPFKHEFLKIKSNHIIMVEWCSEIIKKEIIETNLNLIINHNTVHQFEENFAKRVESNNGKVITINDCLSLFTEKEDLGDNQLFCSQCKKHTSWFKKYEIERLPPYLTLVLKRFKYTRLYKRKIDKLIDFSVNDLNLNKYYCYNNSNKASKSLDLYDLYGVINHSGTLLSGHYTSIIKHGDKWIKYDDNRAFEVEENSVKSPNAYILVYKLKDKDKILSGDYYTLMYNILFVENDLSCYKQEITRKQNKRKSIRRLNSKNMQLEPNNFSSDYKNNSKVSFEKINFLNDRHYVKGEPVKTSYGRGYVKNIYEFEGNTFIEVYFNKGCAKINLNKSFIERETKFVYSRLSQEEEKEIQKKEMDSKV